MGERRETGVNGSRKRETPGRNGRVDTYVIVQVTMLLAVFGGSVNNADFQVLTHADFVFFWFN